MTATRTPPARPGGGAALPSRPKGGGGKTPTPQRRTLPRDEELRLLDRVERGDDAALGRLVDAHLGYVVAIARRYRGWGAPMNDLVQEGVVGLMQAVRRFRPAEGVRLSTYAVWWIRAAIQDHALRSWSLVRLGTGNAQRLLALKLRHLAAELATDTGADGEASIGELARRFGASAGEAMRLARRLAAPDVSLDHVAQPMAHVAAAGRALIDRLTSDWPTPEQILSQVGEARQVRQRLAAALAELSERERFVIRERYFSEARQTFAAIGGQLGISKDRARQLEAAALKKLAAVLGPQLALEGGS